MPSKPVLSDHDASGHLTSPFYGYLPTQSVCYIFLVLFGISTVLHLVQALRLRAWWLLATAVLAGFGEVLGWSGRLWSSYSPLNNTPYLIQIVCTIIAPTPLVGAIFITFGRMSARIGQQYSRLSARLYSRIFLTCDIIALFVQSVGGGIAASASDHKGGELGSNIMLAGILFQLVMLSVFCILMAEFLIRYTRDRRNRRIPLTQSSETLQGTTILPSSSGLDRSMRVLLIGVSLETLFLYIRAIYRTIELADGFNGRIIRTQVYFNVLDGAMVVLAMYTVNIFHPAQLLNDADRRSAAVHLAYKTTTSI